MFQRFSKIVLPIALVAITVVGCSAPDPYVWRPYTIDREHENFPEGPILASGSVIAICYTNRNATPALLTQMAKDECGRFGLSARFNGQDHGLCPLVTPIAARFACEGPTPQIVGGAVVQPSQSETLFQGAGQGGVAGSVLPPMGTTFNAEDVSTRAKSEPYPTFLFNDPQRQARSVPQTPSQAQP